MLKAIVITVKPSFFRQKLELLLLAEEQSASLAVSDFVARHHISFRHVTSLFSLKSMQFGRPQVLLVLQDREEAFSEFAKKIAELLQAFPRSALIIVPRESDEAPVWPEFGGRRLYFLSLQEYTETAKLEYICLAQIRSQYFDITLKELYPMTTIPFTAYLQMPLNQRYLAVVFRKILLNDHKYQRLQQAKSLHVSYNEVDAFIDYTMEYNDSSGRGLALRTRALFLGVLAKSLALNNYLMLDLNQPNPEEGRSYYEDLVRVAKEFVDVLTLGNNTWDVIRESSKNSLWEFWRAPWIGAYAALICAKSQQGDPVKALLAGVLSDIGLLEMSRDVYGAYLSQGAECLIESEDFRRHPLSSVQRCLDRGLPLPEDLQAVMISTHEQADQQGFPYQIEPDKVPVESMVVQLAELIDHKTRLGLTENGPSFRYLKEKIWEKECDRQILFPLSFLEKIAESLL